MGTLVDLTGQKFGRLTVIKRVENNKYGALYWLCQCDCGKFVKVRGSRLKDGSSKSCGCYQKDLIREICKSRTIYKGIYKQLIRVYWAMHARCYNKNTNRYKNYGGRGIKICDEWLNSHLSFCEWAVNNGYQKGLTIDRIDVNKNYSPSNCRWVDYKTQANNKTNTTY